MNLMVRGRKMIKNRMRNYAALSCLFLALMVAGGAFSVRASNQVAPNPETAVQDAGLPVETDAIAGWPKAPAISSQTGILLDGNTGTILYNRGMHQRMYPASTTKIMTALLAIENKSLADIVTMTETGMRDAYSGSSNILPVLGEQFTMEQCLYMILLKSANDVTTQVAEYVGGSEADFVNMMNARAQQLGCQGTHFNNANGLPDENHYTTAYDLSLIMKEALKNDIFRQIINTQTYTVPPTNLTPRARVYKNHHEMLLDGSQFRYEGIIGGKTGFTNASGVTLVTACNRNGRDLISVVMKTGWGEAFLDTTSLMDYGFGQFCQVDTASQNKNLSGIVVLPINKTVKDLKLSDPTSNQVDYLFGGYKVGSGSQIKIAAKEVESQKKTQVKEADKKISKEPSKGGIKNFFRKLRGLLPKTGSALSLVASFVGALLLLALVLTLGFRSKKKQIRGRRGKKRKRRRLK